MNTSEMTSEQLDALDIQAKRDLPLEDKRRLPGYHDKGSPNYFGTLNMRPMGSRDAKTKEWQEMGGEATKQKFLKRKEIKEFISALKDDMEADEEIDALKAMNMILQKHLFDEDYEAAQQVAAQMARFQHPTLASVDSTTRELGLDALSDEELQREIEKIEGEVLSFPDGKKK